MPSPSGAKGPSGPPPRAGTSVVAYFGAALVGAVVALLIAYGLQALGWLPSPGLRQAGEALAAAQAVRSDLATLRQAIPDIGPVESRLESNADRIADLDTRLAALAEAAGRIDSLGSQVAALSAEVAALPRTLPAGPGPASLADGALAALEQRLAALEQSGLPLAQRPDDSALRTELDRLSQEVAALEGRVDALAAGAAAQAETGAAAVALTVAGLRNAASRGEAFAPELDLLSRLGVAAAALDPLRPHAGGARTVADLVAAFPPVAEAIYASAAGEAAEAGFFDRLWGNARSLVTVRPIGPVEGSSLEAIMSRMRASVEAGDLAGALREWEALPDPAKTTSADWAAAAGDRVALDQALAGLAAVAPAAEAP